MKVYKIKKVFLITLIFFILYSKSNTTTINSQGQYQLLTEFSEIVELP